MSFIEIAACFSSFLSLALTIIASIIASKKEENVFRASILQNENNSYEESPLIYRNKIREITVRVIDVALSLLLIICTLPIFMAISFAIGYLYKGAIFDKRMIIGVKGKKVVLHRFRVRKENSREGIGHLDRFLEQTGLAKLPYIFDVFIGRISIAGLTIINYNRGLQFRNEIRDFFVPYNYNKPGVIDLTYIKELYRGHKKRGNAEYAKFVYDTNLDFVRKDNMRLRIYMIYILFMSTIRSSKEV